MGGSQQHHGQVHSEVEDLEYLRLGQAEHTNTYKLCQRDSTEHLEETPETYYLLEEYKSFKK